MFERCGLFRITEILVQFTIALSKPLLQNHAEKELHAKRQVASKEM
jgi:hypothetical protein